MALKVQKSGKGEEPAPFLSLQNVCRKPVEEEKNQRGSSIDMEETKGAFIKGESDGAKGEVFTQGKVFDIKKIMQEIFAVGVLDQSENGMEIKDSLSGMNIQGKIRRNKHRKGNKATFKARKTRKNRCYLKEKEKCVKKRKEDKRRRSEFFMKVTGAFYESRLYGGLGNEVKVCDPSGHIKKGKCVRKRKEDNRRRFKHFMKVIGAFYELRSHGGLEKEAKGRNFFGYIRKQDGLSFFRNRRRKRRWQEVTGVCRWLRKKNKFKSDWT